MDTRIQKVLDGDLDRKELTEAELADLTEAEAAFDAVLRAIPAQPLPPLGPAVLARISDGNRPLARSPARALAWLWRPQAVSLRWRPAYALPVAAAIALVFLMGREQAPPATQAAAQVLVEFRLDAPLAQQVALAGDFTDWKPAYSLVRGEPGVWTIVVPLDPGVHDYAFIVDGERWVPDPMAPAVEDGFGGLNSRVAVLAPDAEAKS